MLLFLTQLACENDSDLARVHERPDVTLAAPALGQVLRVGEEPFLAEAVVADSFTPPEVLELTWTLDTESVAGSADEEGAAAWEMPLTIDDVGPHELALTAVDEDGDEATASVTFSLLGPREAPVVAITAPEDGSAWHSTDSITFQGNASDSVTAAEDLVFAWSADGAELPGAISAGGQSVVVSSLALGEHVVTLSVTDSDGEVGTDTVTVLVADEPPIAEPGDVVFSEMMVDPQVVDDTVGEWVELYNTSGYDLDIGGYTFRDDDVDAYTLAGSIVVPAHDYVVLCANVEAALNGGVPCDAVFFRDSTGNGLALANGEDELVLARPDGTEIDWLHYDETWYSLAIALGVDPKYQDGAANDDPLHWCDQVSVVSTGGEPGTPGLPNDSCP